MPSGLVTFQALSIALFVITGLLLLFATMRQATGWSRTAAWMSFLTVSGAITGMALSYGGEASLDLQSTNGIIRRAAASLRDAHAGATTAAARLSARRPIAIDARLPGVGFRVARTLN